jgi:ABC-type multidrug transport system fused ATPase/permease subunit
VQQLESNVYGRLYESFSAIRLVKSFVREVHELARFTLVAGRAMDARIRLTWQESVFNVLVMGITILGTALVVIVGALAVMKGRLSVGGLLVVMAYLQSVYGPLSSIAHTTGALQQSIAGARRVRHMLDLDPEPFDREGAVPASGVTGHVLFDNVGFAYDPAKPVLDAVSFEAHPGQVVAIVGLTGAGKTTLVSLLPRFYDPTSGRVLLDGRDVREYDLRSLRERIAVVPQDAVLFSGTVADNLRYGRLDASDAEVEAAARSAHAHEFVMRLDKGYSTDLGEGGATLSGGERQRLGIARALLKEAPLLILDEPTSSLDAISEAYVFSALKRLRAGRTTMVIAHRLSTIRDADAIIVLDGGRIAAKGTHDELLDQSPLYRRMCARLSVGRSLDDPETVDELIRAAQ